MARESLNEPLIREQFRAVVPDLSRLYATLFIIVLFVLLLLLPVAPPAILGVWAVLLTGVALIRGLHWRKVAQRLDSFSVEEMRDKLVLIDRFGGKLFMIFASAGLFALYTPDLLLRTVTMLAIWSTAVGSAFYLSVLPRCSRNVIWGVSCCLCAVFLWSGDRALYIASPLFLAVSYALTIQLRRNFEAFRAAVEDRHTIEVLRREAMGLALTDALTGLPNRRGFDARLAVLAGDNRPFALAAIDLDGFKPVNDVFGHGVGDKALVIVAERLRALGSRVFAARFGGDEFVLLMEGADFAEALTQRAMDALAAPYEIDGVSIGMGASCGLAHWRHAGDEKDLLKRADAALYLAKSRPGRTLEPERGRCVVIRSAA